MMTMSERQPPDDEPPDDAAPIDDPPRSADHADIPEDHPRLVKLRDDVASGLATIAILEAQAAARDAARDDAAEWTTTKGAAMTIKEAAYLTKTHPGNVQRWAQQGLVESRKVRGTVEINLTSLKAHLKRRGRFRK
jgi:excisionase family DNA binding protein